MVYNDINESDYVFRYDEFVFYFSSQFYKEKFIKEYANFIKEETMKLKLKFKCELVFDYIILILLYKKIEKRGFKVMYNGYRLRENLCFTSELNAISFES